MISCKIFKDAWTEANVGAVVSALFSALVSRSMTLVSLSVIPKNITFTAKRTGWTYADFQNLQTDIENYCTANSITIVAIQYGEF